jgi:hypothetical protein
VEEIMALPNTLVINNTTGIEVVISDLGIPIGGSASMTLTDYATVQEIKASKSLYDLISSGTIRFRVGGVNMSQAESKRFFIEPLERGSRTGVIVASTANEAISGSGATIDSVAVSTGDRVLLTAQTAQNDNGVWLVQAGSWIRPYDFNIGDATSGVSIVVKRGTENGDALWVCSADPGVDIVGSNPLFFSKQESSGSADEYVVSIARIITNRGTIEVEPEFSLSDITEV